MPKEQNTLDIVQRICKYIDTHLDEDLSYKQIQARFHVTKHTLTTKFPKQVGMTLTKYIIRKRLEFVVLHVQGGMSIETAAYAAGFHTYSHFYEEFTKHFGASPRAYFSPRA